MTLERVRRRAPTLEAVRWTGGNWREVHAFVGDKIRQADREGLLMLKIHPSLNSEFAVPIGNWIIRVEPDRFDTETQQFFDINYEVL